MWESSAPKPSRSLKITTNVIDEETTLAQPFVHYRVGGGEWEKAEMKQVEEDIWSGTIPGQKQDSTIEWNGMLKHLMKLETSKQAKPMKSGLSP